MANTEGTSKNANYLTEARQSDNLELGEEGGAILAAKFIEEHEDMFVAWLAAFVTRSGPPIATDTLYMRGVEQWLARSAYQYHRARSVVTLKVELCGSFDHPPRERAERADLTKKDYRLPSCREPR